MTAAVQSIGFPRSSSSTDSGTCRKDTYSTTAANGILMKKIQRQEAYWDQKAAQHGADNDGQADQVPMALPRAVRSRCLISSKNEDLPCQQSNCTRLRCLDCSVAFTLSKDRKHCPRRVVAPKSSRRHVAKSSGGSGRTRN